MTHKKWQEAEYLYFSEMVLPVFEKNYPQENESNKLAPSGTTSHVKRLRHGPPSSWFDIHIRTLEIRYGKPHVE